MPFGEFNLVADFTRGARFRRDDPATDRHALGAVVAVHRLADLMRNVVQVALFPPKQLSGTLTRSLPRETISVMFQRVLRL